LIPKRPDGVAPFEAGVKGMSPGAHLGFGQLNEIIQRTGVVRFHVCALLWFFVIADSATLTYATTSCLSTNPVIYEILC
jgi:hypothetical protein